MSTIGKIILLLVGIGAVLATAFNVWLLNHRPLPQPIEPPASISVPAEVKGQVGRIIDIEAETAGHTVIWWVGSSPANPDLRTTNSGHTAIFVTPAPGTYVLLAWTAIAGEPTEPVSCRVIVSGAAPVPPPGPQPPPVPPPVPVEPTDAFWVSLKAAWVADVSIGKASYRSILAEIYDQAGPAIVKDTTLKTVSEALSKLHQAAESLIGRNLDSERKAIEKYLNSVLPTSPTAPLDATTRALLAKEAAHVSDYLGRLP